MENNMKIVDYNEYCPSCKHKLKRDFEDPCYDCLNTPARENSHKPLCFEEDGK